MFITAFNSLFWLKEYGSQKLFHLTKHSIFLLSVPTEPASITAQVNGPTSITVTWMAPMTLNGIIVRYELSISSMSLGSSGLGSFNITDSRLEYNATMLSPFTNYTFEVAAVTGAGRGASVTVTDTTDEDGKSQKLTSPFNPALSIALYNKVLAVSHKPQKKQSNQ